MAFDRRSMWRGMLIAGLALASLAPAAHALRIATWNLHEYPQTNGSARHPYMRQVMAGLQADALVVQELYSQDGADSFLFNVLRVAEPARNWKSGGFLPASQSAVYYDSLKVTVTNVASIGTPGPRDVLLCVVKPLGYTATTASTRVYSIHFNAGTADTALRRAECASLRTTLNLAPAGTNLLMGGDTNFYGDWEGGYARLTESQADNDGRLKDPFSMPGTWNQPAYAPYHTQSPCLSGCSFRFATSGLDDRFDLWLSSYPLQDGEGLDLLPGGYIAYGNDGQHYSDDINGGGFNNAVGTTIANALREASDHIPVVLVLQVPARSQSASALVFGDAILGGSPTVNLAVSNGAGVPADELNYTLAASAGFGAPGGGFVANAGAGANAHTLTMATGSTGVKTGTVTVGSDDPDSASRTVQLSGRVLRHASASLESSSVVLAETVDLGGRTSGNFLYDIPVPVYNRGYDGLQARLGVTGGTITGGGGRFSIAGGFSPALIAGGGVGFPIHFDDSGATLDSTYTATLTFTTADEPLPGATAQSSLVVTLVARVLSGTTGVPRIPTTLRFLPPRPNPASRLTRFAFELPRRSEITLEVFDLSGRKVGTPAMGPYEAGRHEVSWSVGDQHGTRLPAGLYFVRFRASGLLRTERLILLP
jgi:endonuclease/exonuclease/phosphatase family metal-dependent hydrolase